MKHIKQIGVDIWWAYVTTKRGDRTEFEGDMWQGSNAEALARAWFEARPEPVA